MKRFKFNLEKVLELRQHSEQEAKNELGKAISILNEIENNIIINGVKKNDAVRERFECINMAGKDGTGADNNAVTEGDAGADTSGVLSMQIWDSYILRLEQEAERLEEQAAKAEKVVEEKRSLYLEASRELKVIEKLKEKRQKEYRKEMFTAETREMDDIWRESNSSTFYQK